MAWNVDLPPAEWVDTDDPERLRCLAAELAGIWLIAIDTETTGLNKMRDLPLFWSLAWFGKDGIAHRICMPTGTLAWFAQLFTDPDRQWVFANANFDCAMLDNVGIHVAGDTIDVIVMHSLLYEEMAHDLKSMAQHVLGYRWDDFKDVFKFSKLGKFTVESTPEEVAQGGSFCTVQAAIMWCRKWDLARLVEYATNDALGTLNLYIELARRLSAAPTQSCLYPNDPPWVRRSFENVADVYFQVELPFTKVLYQMERNGITIDEDYLHRIEKPILHDMDELSRAVTHISSNNGAAILNLNSAKELIAYLHGVKKYQVTKWTKGGKSGNKQPSTDDATLIRLQELYADDAVLEKIRQHGDIGKIHSTYIVGMLQRVGADHRIHTNFNQHVTRTGRLSSSNPNLQNIKRPDEDDGEDPYNIRKAFIAPPGKKLICADYSQLEARLLAVIAQEQDMIGIFQKGWDIHMGNAALMFGLPYDDIKRAKKLNDADWAALTEEETKYFRYCLTCRQDAKTVGFGLNYGMQKWTLAKRLKCSVEEAAAKIEAYMTTYPAVQHFFKSAVEIVRNGNYAYTLLGRRRYLPDIASNDRGDRTRAERQSSNLPVQGTAADVVKMAMLRCHAAQLDRQFGCDMLLQVHDELVFEVPNENAEAAAGVIRDCMEHAFPEELSVPLTISLGIADTWAEAK